jgi:hypothetical protein
MARDTVVKSNRLAAISIRRGGRLSAGMRCREEDDGEYRECKGNRWGLELHELLSPAYSRFGRTCPTTLS